MILNLKNPHAGKSITTQFKTGEQNSIYIYIYGYITNFKFPIDFTTTVTHMMCVCTACCSLYSKYVVLVFTLVLIFFHHSVEWVLFFNNYSRLQVTHLHFSQRQFFAQSQFQVQRSVTFSLSLSVSHSFSICHSLSVSHSINFSLSVSRLLFPSICSAPSLHAELCLSICPGTMNSLFGLFSRQFFCLFILVQAQPKLRHTAVSGQNVLFILQQSMVLFVAQGWHSCLGS